MKGAKLLPYILTGSIFPAAIMLVRGIFSAENSVQRLLCACDGFSVSGLLLLCAAIMMWIAGEGIFDMLGYAVRKGLHHLIPGRHGNEAETFYDYKSRKQEKKSPSGVKGFFIAGASDMAVGLLLTVLWYVQTGSQV